ncbi:MAG: carbohydrate kinase [Oscillospiraceae bacterium]|nr:carbohydrate kinase [Oscillospiraceae bacterium]
MMDVTALGELLIDFTPCREVKSENPVFEENPGGAPCNVLAMLARCGRRTAFIGKVGEDAFGRRLRSVIEGAGICADGLTADPTCNTTLAFVHLDERGERSFSFVRRPGADTLLRREEIPPELLQTRIFHFGTLSMTGEPARDATRFAVEEAKKAGALISFDPNWRPPLWESLEAAREQMLWGIGRCDILKISDDEILFLTGERDVQAGARRLLQYGSPQILFATCGREGSHALWRGEWYSAPAFSVRSIDTTGAGDVFMGAALHCLLDGGPNALTPEKVEETLRFAGAAAAIVTTRRGAIRSVPTLAEIAALRAGEVF